MAHGDDDGLVFAAANRANADRHPAHHAKGRNRDAVLEACDKLAKQLRQIRYVDLPIEVEVDRRDLGRRRKELGVDQKGVPLRLEIGPRDLESAQ